MLSSFSPVQFFVTPWTVAARLLCPWDSLGENTGVDCHALLPPGYLPNPENEPMTPVWAWLGELCSGRGPTLNWREIDDKCLLRVYGSPIPFAFITNRGNLQWNFKDQGKSNHLFLQTYNFILRATNLHGLKLQFGSPSAHNSKTVIKSGREVCLVGWSGGNPPPKR